MSSAATTVTIRPLAAADAAAFQQLHQSVIVSNPECFCTDVSEARQYRLQFYRYQIKHNSNTPHKSLYGAFDQDQQLLGMVGIEQLSGMMRCHKARLWGLMVAPGYRRSGIAQQLCQQAISFAKHLGVEKITLELTGQAIAAMHLYRRLNFKIDSIETMALKLDGHYLDEVRMSLLL